MFSKFTISEPFLDINTCVEKTIFNYQYTNETKFSNSKKLNFTHDFKINMEILMKKTINMSLSEQLLQITMNKNWSNTTYICQDQDSILLTSILNALISNGFSPNVIRNSGKIIVLEIKSIEVRFLTSNTYFQGNEFNIAKQFDIKFDQHFFPISLSFQILDKLRLSESLPDLSFFISNQDSCEEINKKKNFMIIIKSITKLGIFKRNF